MDRFDRIFRLNQILQAARLPVSRKTIEDELECSTATAKRVIDELRNFLGAPLEYDRERNGYYYDRQGAHPYELPGLWFSEAELHALLTVQQLLAKAQPGLLDEQLAPLRERIDALLRDQRTGGGDEIGRRVRILSMAARPAGDYFRVVAGAVLKRRRLHLHYRDRVNDAETEREVSPQRLVHYRDNWYLDAWCHLRGALRSFALDRILSAASLAEAADEIPDETLHQHYASAYGIFAGKSEHTALLRFTPERARWVAAEQWHPQQQSRYLEDGSYELSIPYADPRELVMDILKHGAEVEVLSPPGLRREVGERLRRAAARYPDTMPGD